MNLAFDTLAFAQRLQTSGISPEEAASHANAIRDFVIPEMLTKADLLENDSKLAAISRDIAGMDQRLESRIAQLESRLTLRMGGMMAAGVGIVAALVKLL